MNKKVLQKLRDIAARLPLSYVKGKKYMLHNIKDMRAKEIKNSQFFSSETSIENLISEAPEYITIKKDTLYKVNHYRRIKKAFQERGKEGVHEYFRWVDQNNKRLNSEYETKLVTEVVATILKEKINEFM